MLWYLEVIQTISLRSWHLGKEWLQTMRKLKNSAVKELADLIQIFLSGEDHSVTLANKIEALVIQEFSDAEFYDDLILSLSLYRPGGGDFLDDEERLSQELHFVFEQLQRFKQ